MRLVGSFLLLLVACAIELLAVARLWGGGAGIGPYVGSALLHIGAAGLCAHALSLRVNAPDLATRLFQTGWVVGFAVPIFGPLGCVVLWLSGVSPRKVVGGLSREQARSHAAAAALERKRGEQQLGAGIDALVDALKDRDARVRVAAIDALKDDTSRDAVKLFAHSRNNTVFDVRVRAVEGLGRIAKQWSDRLADARAEWTRAPAEAEANRKLAAICLEYAGLGLEGAELARDFYAQAVRHAETSLASGWDRDSALTLATALSHLDRFEEAEAVYLELCRAGGDDATVLLGVAQMQFARQDLRSLPLTCRQLARRGGRSNPTFAEALKLWVR